MNVNIDPAIVQQITTVIREAVAEDWIQDFSIDANTSFNEDLELESIEFVSIAAGLQRHFGEQVDLVGWLSTQSLNELITLRVGNIAEFVVKNLVASGRQN